MRSTLEIARENGHADGLRNNKCDTSSRDYKLSWPQKTEYLAGYIDGMNARLSGVRFPEEA